MTREGETRWSGWFSVCLWPLWLAVRDFALSPQRQATSKGSIGISALRLLPRLEEVYIRRFHSHASRHASKDSGLPTRTCSALSGPCACVLVGEPATLVHITLCDIKPFLTPF